MKSFIPQPTIRPSRAVRCELAPKSKEREEEPSNRVRGEGGASVIDGTGESVTGACREGGQYSI